MEKILVAICEDEQFFREEVEKMVSVYANESESDIEIGCYEAATYLVEDVLENQKQYDLLFLDVEMEGMSGIELAKLLRQNGYEGVICFVTSKDQYALEAFSVDAIGYIKKPAKYRDVKRMMQKAMVCYESLKNVYERLDKQKFYYTHQGFIVNFDKIKEVKKDIVCLGAGREIPVSRRYQNELRELHLDKIYRLRQERSANN